MKVPGIVLTIAMCLAGISAASTPASAQCYINVAGQCDEGACPVNIVSSCGPEGSCLVNAIASYCSGECTINVVAGRCADYCLINVAQTCRNSAPSQPEV